MITRDDVTNLLFYSPLTGEFLWNGSRGCKRGGDEAGCVNKGYRWIKINGKRYAAHKLAVLVMTGQYPTGDVDHEDGDKLNNRFDNLRLATRSQNAQNSRVFSNNELGVKGVRILKDTGKYQVRVDGKSYGCYWELDWAITIASEIRKRFHGEFARNE